MVGDMKDKKGFQKRVSSRRQTRENVGSLLSGVRDLVTKDMETAVVFYAFTALAITGKTCFQESQSHPWEGLEQRSLTPNGRGLNWGAFKQNGHTQVHRM